MSKSRQRFPSLLQALIICASGIVLGASSCFGFLSTFNSNGSSQTVPVIFGAGFFAGIVLLITGFVSLIFVSVREIFFKPSAAALPAALEALAGPAILPGQTWTPNSPEFQTATGRLNIALIARLLLVGVFVLLRVRTFAVQPRYSMLFLASYVLGALPYAIALLALRSRWYTAAIALAAGYCAASLLHQLFDFYTLASNPYMRTHSPVLAMLPGLFIAAAVLWFAIAAYRASPPLARSPATVLLVFVISWIYVVFLLPRLLHGVS